MKTAQCPDCGDHVQYAADTDFQQEQTNRAIALGRHSEQVWQQKNPGVDPYARWRGEA